MMCLKNYMCFLDIGVREFEWEGDVIKFVLIFLIEIF